MYYLHYRNNYYFCNMSMYNLISSIFNPRNLQIQVRSLHSERTIYEASKNYIDKTKNFYRDPIATVNVESQDSLKDPTVVQLIDKQIDSHIYDKKHADIVKDTYKKHIEYHEDIDFTKTAGFQVSDQLCNVYLRVEIPDSTAKHYVNLGCQIERPKEYFNKLENQQE